MIRDRARDHQFLVGWNDKNIDFLVADPRFSLLVRRLIQRQPEKPESLDNPCAYLGGIFANATAEHS